MKTSFLEELLILIYVILTLDTVWGLLGIFVRRVAA